MSEKQTCLKCDGLGWYIYYDVEYYNKTGKERPVRVQCENCLGVGRITTKNNEATK